MSSAERYVPMPLKLVHSDETAGNRGPDECKQALSHQVAQDQSIYSIESRTVQSTMLTNFRQWREEVPGPAVQVYP
jgi:hypothetical protein